MLLCFCRDPKPAAFSQPKQIQLSRLQGGKVLNATLLFKTPSARSMSHAQFVLCAIKQHLPSTPEVGAFQWWMTCLPFIPGVESPLGFFGMKASLETRDVMNSNQPIVHFFHLFRIIKDICLGTG